MTTIQLLTNQAIQAAAQGKWEEAKSQNEAIIEIEPSNVGALNRLAFCELQSGKHSKARELYEKVLTVERFNPIATKYLALLKKKAKPVVGHAALTSDFIEEPGKTKSVALTKLADPDVLQSTPIAQTCSLVSKNHRVNVVTDAGAYLGSLPDDVAFRLQKMLLCGTTYVVSVQSTTKKSCVVFIKELVRGQNAPYATSFLLNSQSRAHAQEDVLLDEAPLDIRETGDEAEENDVEEADPME